MSIQRSLEQLAKMIDEADFLLNEQLANDALARADELESKLESTQFVEFYYFKANAWSSLRRIKHQDESRIWGWQQEEILHEIYYLRCAITHSAFETTDDFRKCQILVNTGNILNHIGRPIEAIEYWRRALTIIPSFAMAKVNLALGWEVYGKLLYDRRHSCLLLNQAYKMYSSLKTGRLIWDSEDFKQIFSTVIEHENQIRLHVDVEKIDSIPLDGYSLGRSKVERIYRVWVLENTLFLNPLNDIGAHSIASTDILHLPSLVTDQYMVPHHYGFFNQLKQEFASARYQLWQSISECDLCKKHVSDKDVYLVDTLDFSRYGMAIEQVKLAFRSSYSLLDKVAYFINDYWDLGLPKRQITFSKVWYKNAKKIDGIHLQLENLENNCLRGLYWLSKDFVDEGNEGELLLGKVMEPDATKLAGLRNHLEHKYVKVHDEFFFDRDLSGGNFFDDELALHISTEELIAKSIKLLKLIRASLVYLSLAVHREEQVKASKKPNFKMPVIMTPIK
ncbi:LA2681 family HEPN domain-containing protein [Methylophilus sp. 3sh_L]|uniref:LA2681 family HEPN domain-containing protein n=1 Tax=Methylophilus sp. 3sh_L TaxID=3377114 RepID=UPI00398EF606